MIADPEAFLADRAGGRLPLIAESYRRLTGRPLLNGDDGPAALWRAQLVILAHGTEPARCSSGVVAWRWSSSN